MKLLSNALIDPISFWGFLFIGGIGSLELLFDVLSLREKEIL